MNEIVDTIASIPKRLEGHQQEKNIALQSLYQSLLLSYLHDTKDVASYDTLRTLLEPNKVVHMVRGTDGSVSYAKDGDGLSGAVLKSYASLKEYSSSSVVQGSERTGSPIGEVESWAHYKVMIEALQDPSFTLFNVN